MATNEVFLLGTYIQLNENIAVSQTLKIKYSLGILNVFLTCNFKNFDHILIILGKLLANSEFFLVT